MQKEVKKSWALFIGIGVMMIAHGLQMQVMGIRSVLEDFSVFTTGIFMSGYFVGYFVGSRTTPNFVSKSWANKSICCIRVTCFFKCFNCCSLCKSVYVDNQQIYNRV
jgi:hypothetical protein